MRNARLSCLLCLALATASMAQTVYIADNNFLKGIIANGVDTNGDNKIDVQEAAAAKTLNLLNLGAPNAYNISSMIGIEAFVNLQNLFFSNNKVTNINLSKNTALTSLLCNNSGLSKLDLSNNKKLIELNCSNNGISTLDLSDKPSLRFLTCRSTKLEILDISKNDTLMRAYLYNNGSLTTICVKNVDSALSNPNFIKDTKAAWSASCVTGLSDIEQTKEPVSVYPNPAKDVVHVGGDVGEIGIYDNMGVKIMTSYGNKFSVSTLPIGVYQIILNIKNDQRQSFKLIKE